MMLVDFRIYDFGSNRPEPVQGSLFVSLDQARIASHISRQDRRETTGGIHAGSPAAMRKPDRNSTRSAEFRYGRSLRGASGAIALSRARIVRASSSRPAWA